jgi:hypothetical protein
MARKDFRELEEEFKDEIKDDETAAPEEYVDEQEQFEAAEKEEIQKNQPTIKRVNREVTPQAATRVRPVQAQKEEVQPSSTQTLAQTPVYYDDEQVANRFDIYSVRERIGIIDNETKKPLYESPDPTTIILQALAEILSRLDKIEISLGR